MAKTNKNGGGMQLDAINSKIASGAMSRIIAVDDTRVQQWDKAEFANVRQAFRTRNHMITPQDRLGLYKSPAWTGLGEVIDEGLSGVEAVDKYLGWFVEETQAYCKIDGKPVALPMKATVRSDTREVLGVVSSDYTVVQNRTMGQFADALVGTDAAVTMETCGSLLAGRKVFLLVRIPKELRVGKTGEDVSVPYLLLASGHDGSMAFTVRWCFQRVVCNNTWTAALSGVESDASAFRIRHTTNAATMLDEARSVLGIAAKGIDSFQRIAEQLATKHLNDVDGTSYLRSAYQLIYGEVDEQSTKEQDETARARRDRIVGEWRTLAESPTNTIDGIGGTLWAYYNAVSEWQDWVRGASIGDDRQTHSKTLGIGALAKQKAMHAALALV